MAVENALLSTSETASFAASSRSPRIRAGQLGHRREIGHPDRAVDPDRDGSPSLSAATSRSTSRGRTPALPVANPFASCRMVARTTSSGAGGPCPMNNESIIRRLCSDWSSGASRCRLRAATPVVSPYAGDPAATTFSTTARPAAIRAATSAWSSTCSRPRATRMTSLERQGASGDRDGHWRAGLLDGWSWGNVPVPTAPKPSRRTAPGKCAQYPACRPARRAVSPLLDPCRKPRRAKIGADGVLEELHDHR